jgi:hypothetical protein
MGDYPYSIYNQVFSQGFGGIADALRKQRDQEALMAQMKQWLGAKDTRQVPPQYGVAPAAEFQMNPDTGQATQLPTPERPMVRPGYEVQTPRDPFSMRNLPLLMQFSQTPQGQSMLSTAAMVQKQNAPDWEGIGSAQTGYSAWNKKNPGEVQRILPGSGPTTSPDDNLRFDTITVDEKGKPVQYRVAYDKTTNKEISRQLVGAPWQNPITPRSSLEDERLATGENQKYQARVLPYRTQINQFDTMVATAKASKLLKNRAGGDQALVMIFNKILDPNSVVREGEFDRYAGMMPLLNKAKLALQRVGSGGTLTEDERDDILTLGEAWSKIAREKMKLFRKGAENRIKAVNLDPEVWLDPEESGGDDLDAQIKAIEDELAKEKGGGKK